MKTRATTQAATTDLCVGVCWPDGASAASSTTSISSESSTAVGPEFEWVVSSPFAAAAAAFSAAAALAKCLAGEGPPCAASYKAAATGLGGSDAEARDALLPD